jgi:hypothetical protein
VNVFRLEGLRELSGVDGTHVRRRKASLFSSVIPSVALPKRRPERTQFNMRPQFNPESYFSGFFGVRTKSPHFALLQWLKIPIAAKRHTALILYIHTSKVSNQGTHYIHALL